MDQANDFRVGQRPQQQLIDDGKQRGVAANTQCEREGDRQGKGDRGAVCRMSGRRFLHHGGIDSHGSPRVGSRGALRRLGGRMEGWLAYDAGPQHIAHTDEVTASRFPLSRELLA